MRNVLTALLVAALPLAAAADPVQLGAVFNQSGSQAAFDGPSLQAARLAVQQANDAGKDPVELVLADPAGEVAKAASSTAAMLDAHPEVLATFGLSDTDMVLAAAPEAAKRGRVFLTTGATSPKLPAEVPEWLFLACFGDNVQAAAAAEFAHGTLGARSVAIVYNDATAYTRLLQGYFRARFEELGGTIAETRSYGALDGQAAVIAGLAAADAVFLSAQVPSEAAAGIAALRADGFAGPILGGDGYDGQDVWAAHPEITDVYFTTHVYLGADNPNPAVSAFVDAYGEAYDGAAPDGFAALSYDAVGLLLAAADAAPDATPDALRQALGSISGYQGVTGTISFEDGARIPRKSVAIIKIAAGKLSLAQEVLPDQVPPP